jgi:serine/threonine protein phosphatase PrpC
MKSASSSINILTSEPAYKQGKYGLALDEAFRKMDELIISETGAKFLNQQRNAHESDPVSSHTGCTANVVLITPNSYIVANAGDSRSVLCRDGKAIDLSYDHKPES